MIALELHCLLKDFGSLRPLRIERLQVDDGDAVAILGLDQAAAEVLINLVVGASVPDSGEVLLLGRRTASVADADDWLALVDQVGIVTDRAVLLDAFTVTQNLSIPFTLEVDPPAADIRARANALAREAAIPEATWERPIAELDAATRLRVRFARALALDPAMVLLEHPTADLLRRGSHRDSRPIGRDIRHAVERRRAALVTVTADEAFARSVARRVLRLDGATGRLDPL